MISKECKKFSIFTKFSGSLQKNEKSSSYEKNIKSFLSLFNFLQNHILFNLHKSEEIFQSFAFIQFHSVAGVENKTKKNYNERNLSLNHSTKQHEWLLKIFYGVNLLIFAKDKFFGSEKFFNIFFFFSPLENIIVTPLFGFNFL